MLLIVASAVLGAFMGLNSHNRLLAALVAGALAGALHVILLFTADAATFYAAQPGNAKRFFEALGVHGQPLHSACSAAAAALVAGLLVALTEPRERPGLYVAGDAGPRRRRRRRTNGHQADYGRGITFGRVNAALDD